jgi:hypothetical protein
MEAPILSAAISGMLKIVLNKLAPLVIRKYSSIVGVKRDLEELQSLAEEINSWLERAGYIAMGNDPSLNWLKQLKEVAYDVDDVVDAFQLEAQKHEAQHYGDIVSKYMHKKAKSFVFQWKAASEIRTIKKRFSAIARQRIELGAIIANTLPSGCPVHHMNQTTVKVPSLPIVDASSVVGRNEYKSTVISKLKETKDQQEIEIVSVIGLGGTGKTTLAKLVFSDEDTIRHLFEVRIWVHVSKECDDLVIIKKLFEAITKNNSEHHPLNHMSENITVALTGKTFLLVLDDVWIEDRIQWVQTCSSGSNLWYI